MIATKPVLIIRHRLWRRTANPQLPRKSPEQRSQHNIHLSVRQRHTNTLSRATSEGHHVVVEALRLLGALEPTLRIEFHRVGEDFRVAVHHPGGHADDGAFGEEVAVDGGAGLGDYARQAADDAEGEAEAFFYYCGLSR